MADRYGACQACPPCNLFDILCRQWWRQACGPRNMAVGMASCREESLGMHGHVECMHGRGSRGRCWTTLPEGRAKTRSVRGLETWSPVCLRAQKERERWGHRPRQSAVGRPRERMGEPPALAWEAKGVVSLGLGGRGSRRGSRRPRPGRPRERTGEPSASAWEAEGVVGLGLGGRGGRRGSHRPRPGRPRESTREPSASAWEAEGEDGGAVDLSLGGRGSHRPWPGRPRERMGEPSTSAWEAEGVDKVELGWPGDVECGSSLGAEVVEMERTGTEVGNKAIGDDHGRDGPWTRLWSWGAAERARGRWGSAEKESDLTLSCSGAGILVEVDEAIREWERSRVSGNSACLSPHVGLCKLYYPHTK